MAIGGEGAVAAPGVDNDVDGVVEDVPYFERSVGGRQFEQFPVDGSC